MQNPLHAEFAYSLHDVYNAFEYRVYVSVRRMIGVWNCNECGKVNHEITALHRFAYPSCGSRTIAGKKMSKLSRISRGDRSKHYPPRSYREQIGRTLYPLRTQSLDKVGSNEAICSGYKNFLMCSRHTVPYQSVPSFMRKIAPPPPKAFEGRANLRSQASWPHGYGLRPLFFLPGDQNQNAAHNKTRRTRP